MPRRGNVPKRDVLPDPIYGNKKCYNKRDNGLGMRDKAFLCPNFLPVKGFRPFPADCRRYRSDRFL